MTDQQQEQEQHDRVHNIVVADKKSLQISSQATLRGEPVQIYKCNMRVHLFLVISLLIIWKQETSVHRGQEQMRPSDKATAMHLQCKSSPMAMAACIIREATLQARIDMELAVTTFGLTYDKRHM